MVWVRRKSSRLFPQAHCFTETQRWRAWGVTLPGFGTQAGLRLIYKQRELIRADVGRKICQNRLQV